MRIVELAFLDNILAKLTESFRKKRLTLLMSFHNVHSFKDLHNLPLPGIVVKVSYCPEPPHQDFGLEELNSAHYELKVDFLLLRRFEALV